MAVKKTPKPRKKTKPAARAKAPAKRPPAVRAVSKPPAGKDGKPVPAGKPRRQGAVAVKVNNQQAPEARTQYQAFERAIQLFHKRHFRDAREWFEKARGGPVKEVAANAELHVRMCERRLSGPGPTPRTLEEHYTYAVALINSRKLAEARQHLEAALKMDAQADHVLYAHGVCLALSGDLAGAYDSLKRAIELQPRNRMLARQDSDLEEFAHRPPLERLLYPEA